MLKHLLNFNLLLLYFLQAVFASGILPIIHSSIPEYSAFAYGFYFLGLLLGQFLVSQYAVLSSNRYYYPIFESLFGISLYLMGFFFSLQPYSLIIGRALEGMAAGLALPLGFTYISKLDGFGDIKRRISLFNSVFALGFVAGPPLISNLMETLSSPDILKFFGLVFILINFGVALSSKTLDPYFKKSPTSEAQSTSQTQWFDTFYTLFLAKCFYGFFLPYLSEDLIDRFKPFSMSEITLFASSIFILGQVLSVFITRKLPLQFLKSNLPLILLFALGSMIFTGKPEFIFSAALIHSILLFVSYVSLSQEPSTSIEFAKLNCLSDFGMLIGAALAYFHVNGTYGICLLCVVPLLRFVLSPAQNFRAEHHFPYLGPFSLLKVFAKQKNPLIEVRDFPKTSLRSLTFRTGSDEKTNSQTLKLAFAGDWGPCRNGISISHSLRNYLEQHHLRMINLEGSQTTFNYDQKNDRSFYDIPRDQFDHVIWDKQDSHPAFNVISIVNNHILDRGSSKIDETFHNLRNDRSSIVPVTGALSVIEAQEIRVGITARAFGSNLFWRKHPKMQTIKPEQIIGSEIKANLFIDQLKQMKNEVDLLILSYHWGFESEYWPSGIQRECWKILKNAGVDILFGHHSHIVQPFELSPDKSALCLYSCGNFALDMPLKVYQQGAIFSVDIQKLGNDLKMTRVETRFTQVKNSVVEMIDHHESEAFQNWQCNLEPVELSQS